MLHKYFISPLNHLYHIAAIGFLITLISSCNADPTDYIDEKEMFSSVEKLEQAALGVYESWYPEYTIRISSLITDECNIGSQNTGLDAVGQSIFRWTFSSDDDDVLAPWQNGYEVIGRVNNILKGIDGVPVKNDEEEQKRTSIKGELLAIRAFVHFDLYRIYGYSGTYDSNALAVPYIKVSKTSNQPSRPNTGAFFENLWQDLQDAELLNPDDHNIRMGITAIECLHARIALYTGKYDEAIDYAGRVIDKVPLTSSADFSSLWTDSKNGEVIFKLKRSNVNAIRPGDIFYNISSDKVLFSPSEKLQQLYDTDNDTRYESWFEDDEEQSFIVTKYAGNEGNRNLNDVKVFRTSEMYLIRAEAFLTMDNSIGLAQNDLNTLRTHRISNYQDESFGNNSENLFAAIVEERLKEFPYEGHRYFDLKRLGKSIERKNSQILETTSQHYYIPIPQSEVMANPNIRPNNKGW